MQHRAFVEQYGWAGSAQSSQVLKTVAVERKVPWKKCQNLLRVMLGIARVKGSVILTLAGILLVGVVAADQLKWTNSPSSALPKVWVFDCIVRPCVPMRLATYQQTLLLTVLNQDRSW